MKEYLINGFVDPKFDKVRNVFIENFEKRDELGAACAVFINNEKVIDLWGGYADAKKTKAWQEDTKALVFSSTKGFSSLAFATLHSKGLFDFDDRVSKHWPEFAQNGKEKITIRQLLAHEAGLMVIDKLISLKKLGDKEKLADILAEQQPHAKAIGKKAYHTWTISLYQSELARRIDPLKRSIGTLFYDEIASQLNADFHIGIPFNIEDEEIAEIIAVDPLNTLKHKSEEIPLKLIFNFLNPFSFATRSFLNPPLAMSPRLLNARKIKDLEIGSANGIGTARAMAKIYGEFAAGGTTIGLDSKTIQALEYFPDNKNNGKEDMILKENLIFSLGLEKPSSFFNFGTNNRAYGHQGAGGSAAFADPELKLGFAYNMNRMGTSVANDPREKALREAVYQCL
ncbi:MAG: serine hydrolase domain-containing protein [Chitinophagales bacterium]